MKRLFHKNKDITLEAAGILLQVLVKNTDQFLKDYEIDKSLLKTSKRDARTDLFCVTVEIPATKKAIILENYSEDTNITVVEDTSHYFKNRHNHK